MSEVHSVVVKFQTLLDELSALISEANTALKPGGTLSPGLGEALYTCQVKVVNFVADVLSCHSEAVAIDAAVRAFETVLSTCRHPVLSEDSTTCSVDYFQLNVATIVLGLFCSVDLHRNFDVVSTVLRLMVPIVDVIGFVDDEQLRTQAVAQLATLVAHPSSSLAVRTVSAGILCDDSFVIRSSSLSQLKALVEFIGEKILAGLLLAVNSIEDDQVAEFVHWQVVALLKLWSVSSNELGESSKDIISKLFGDSADPVSSLPFVMLRVLRRASASLRSSTNAKLQNAWRSALTGLISLVQNILEKTSTKILSADVTEAFFTFQVVDEIIEILRRSDADDEVSLAVLNCLKTFCCLPALPNKTLNKFFSANCHLTTFKYLTETLESYLKMNFRHLLLPAFELLEMLTAGPFLPDSVVATSNLMASALSAFRTLQRSDLGVVVRSVSTLLGTRFATLPLIYEPVEVFMEKITNEIAMTVHEGEIAFDSVSTLVSAACRLTDSLTLVFDWPSLEVGLTLLKDDDNSRNESNYRFFNKMIDFVKKLITSICVIGPESISEFKSIIESLGRLIDFLPGKSLIFEEIHQFQPFFTSFCLEIASPSTSKVIIAVVNDFLDRKIEKWRENTIKISEESINFFENADSVKSIIASFLTKFLSKKVNDLVLFFVSGSYHDLPPLTRDDLLLTMVFAACSSEGKIDKFYRTEHDCENFKHILSVGFREIFRMLLTSHEKSEVDFAYLVMLFSVNFVFEVAATDSTTIPLNLANEIDGFFTTAVFNNENAGLENDFQWWFFVQPCFSTWCIVRAGDGFSELAKSCFPAILRNFEKTGDEKSQKWSKHIFEILVNQQSAQLSMFSNVLVDVSLRLSLLGSWQKFLLGLFEGKSEDFGDLLENLRKSILRRCFEKMSFSSVSDVVSTPTDAFLVLATMSLCDCSGSSVIDFFIEQDRLVLAAFMNRLVHAVFASTKPLNRDDEISLLTFFNFLNAVLAVYQSASIEKSQVLRYGLENLVKAVVSTDALIDGILEIISKPNFDDLTLFSSRLVTIKLLNRFSVSCNDDFLLEKLILPACQPFLQPCSCTDGSKIKTGCCLPGLLASLMTRCHGNQVQASICRDFTEQVLLPRFVASNSFDWLNGVVVKSLYQFADWKLFDELLQALGNVSEDDPWALMLSQDLGKVDQDSKDCGTKVERKTLVPVFGNGIVHAIDVLIR